MILQAFISFPTKRRIMVNRLCIAVTLSFVCVILSVTTNARQRLELLVHLHPSVSASSMSTQELKDLPLLEVGKPVEKELAGGQSHSYRLQLTAGQFLAVVSEQRGIDIVVSIFDKENKLLTEVDSPNGANGPEPLSFIAAVDGTYRLEIRSLEKEVPAGRYELKIMELRVATAMDRNRVGAQKAYYDADQLRGQMTADSLRKAIGKYLEAASMARAASERQIETDATVSAGVLHGMLGEKEKAIEYYMLALDLSRAAGDRGNEAIILNNLGVVHDDMSEKQKALQFYAQALPIYQALGDRVGLGRLLNNIGKINDDLGDKQKAIEYYQQGLTHSRAGNDVTNVATILNNIGKAYQDLDENQKALDNYAEALPLLRAIGDHRSEAIVNSNVGRVYQDLGDLQRALNYYLQALPASRAAGDRISEARTLNNIGGVQTNLGDKHKALDFYGQSLKIWQTLGDRQSQAITLLNIGSVNSDLGNRQEALDTYTQALSLSRLTGDRAHEGTILNNIGWEYYLLKEWKGSLEYYEQALSLVRDVGDHRGEAQTLDNIALLERDQGQLLSALKHQEASIGIVETLRTRVVSQELRASYFATVQRSYKVYVDILMQLHQQDSSKGYAQRALQASERGRARSLLEVLTEAKANISEGADAQLLESEKTLLKQLDFKEAAQANLLSRQHTAEQAIASKREIESLLDEYEAVKVKIKATSPRYAALTQPQPLDVAGIQKELDADTILLEYTVGDVKNPRSYLWFVSSKAINSYELPSGVEIEKTARAVYDFVNARNRRIKGETPDQKTTRVTDADAKLPEAAAALSKMLFSTVATKLGKKRLVIVADGALQYIPFAALPISDVPMIVEHEVVMLPSASTIAVLRRETNGRALAPKMLAVLADPVFEKDDPRLDIASREKPKAESTTSDTRILEQDDDDSDGSMNSATSFLLGRWRIRRLPFSRQEAERILAIAPVAQSMGAFDFDADRDAAMNAELSKYRFVHFATHGYLDAERPELSALVLSLVDAKGNPKSGFLRAHEIYNLKLPAELVVLSACQTGLGKEIKGEGLVGLTRGFMYAGARRVIVSLWSVSDKATAGLMEKFYQGMLVRKQSPAAALRAAQIAMIKEKQWSAPYYWAAFALQGEWR